MGSQSGGSGGGTLSSGRSNAPLPIPPVNRGNGGPGNSGPQQKVVIALYPYEGRDDGELSFEKNEKLVVVDDSEPDWWLAYRLMAPERRGYIPMNFVVNNVIETEERRNLRGHCNRRGEHRVVQLHAERLCLMEEAVQLFHLLGQLLLVGSTDHLRGVLGFLVVLAVKDVELPDATLNSGHILRGHRVSASIAGAVVDLLGEHSHHLRHLAVRLL
ncbi:hypothetical protein TYRP_022346 [Tyrophagus putrescentiae]|nr:hypothetical protein TYRP_022346 [Tyrophagus putrescentiae]